MNFVANFPMQSLYHEIVPSNMFCHQQLTRLDWWFTS